MISLKNGYLTDGTSYADIDDIVHIEKNHPETFLVTVNDGSDSDVMQFYGDSSEMMEAIAIQNAYVDSFTEDRAEEFAQ